jgi:hypothetical protein
MHKRLDVVTLALPQTSDAYQAWVPPLETSDLHPGRHPLLAAVAVVVEARREEPHTKREM